MERRLHSEALTLYYGALRVVQGIDVYYWPLSVFKGLDLLLSVAERVPRNRFFKMGCWVYSNVLIHCYGALTVLQVLILFYQALSVFEVNGIIIGR